MMADGEDLVCLCFKTSSPNGGIIWDLLFARYPLCNEDLIAFNEKATVDSRLNAPCFPSQENLGFFCFLFDRALDAEVAELDGIHFCGGG